MSAGGELGIRFDHLDPAGVAALLAERQRAYAAPPDQTSVATTPVLVWTLGSERFACPVEAVSAVAPLDRVTRIPAAPPSLVGVISRRGVLYNVFDPARMLGALGAESGSAAHLLILRHAQPRLALRVGSVERLADLPAEQASIDTLTRFVAVDDGPGFTLISPQRLIEQLLDRRGSIEG